MSVFSLYQNNKAKSKEQDIDVINYVRFVQYGTYRAGVEACREAKKKGDLELYKKLKNQQACITSSAVMKKDGGKNANNVESMNGFIAIDIDTELDEDILSRLKADKYTHIAHRSIGFDGACIFVKISTNKKFIDSFLGLAQYYLDTYNVTVDPACKNVNRLRYMSFDPEIYHNEKSQTFSAKAMVKEIKPRDLEFVFTKSDFNHILEQIKDRGIDLCKEDYQRYVNIGMGIASELGAEGEEAFHFICSQGGKYVFEHAKKDYAGFVKNSQGTCTIATVYYYAKEAGCSMYTEKTINIINRVKISKAQGKPTVESVEKNYKTIYNEELTDEEKNLIAHLIQSKNDYSRFANAELTEIEQLTNFIVETFEPTLDVITNVFYINGETASDLLKNDVYLTAKKNFEFLVTKADITSILNSSAVKKINNVKSFFEENSHNEVGFIEQYARMIEPQNDYNVWAFTKWICGAVHNWTSDYEEEAVSPLTLVLTGQRQGTGKTSFFRHMLPDSLKKYLKQQKIDAKDKDSVYALCSSLIVLDDEFGGNAVKDVKVYKEISDKNHIHMRRPYGTTVEDFKRRAALGGTSNEFDICKDITGNRRILPINVEGTAYHDIVLFDKVKLWVEAYNMVREGYEWRIYSNEDIAYLEENTQGNTEHLPAEELFFTKFQLESNGKFNQAVVMNKGELLEYFASRTSLKMTKHELNDVFVKNKIVYKNHKLEDGKSQKKGVLLFTQYETAHPQSLTVVA